MGGALYPQTVTGCAGRAWLQSAIGVSPFFRPHLYLFAVVRNHRVNSFHLNS